MSSRLTKNVVLTDRHVEFIKRLVESGRYQNASEVVREGLRALEDRLKREELELAELRNRLEVSLGQLDRGIYVDEPIGDAFDSAFEKARRRSGL